jgi:hypothetical protein
MTELLPTPSSVTSSTPAAPTFEERVANIRAFVDGQRTRKTYSPGWFGEMETGLRWLLLELERDLTKEVMVAHDVDAAAVEIAGIEHRRVLRAEQTYMTAAGPVTVE